MTQGDSRKKKTDNEERADNQPSRPIPPGLADSLLDVAQMVALHTTGITISGEVARMSEAERDEAAEKYRRISKGINAMSADGERLGRKERGLVEAVEALRERRAVITDDIIAGEMMQRGVYSEVEGEAYSREEINRTKNKLRRLGYDV